MKRVLVIDDDLHIRRLLKLSLEAKNYEYFEAPNAFEGLQSIPQVRPDIILMDLGLPDLDGSELLVSIRAHYTTPLIVLSVRNSEADIVQLLNNGADDYVTKPFKINELHARMSVALRRDRPNPKSNVLSVGDLEIDFELRQVSIGGITIHLTPTEYSILKLLGQWPGRLITHSQMLKELYGPVSEMESGSLRVHVSALRKKIKSKDSQTSYIVTEPGIGYRLSVS